jgi:hypothetical protein
MSTVRQVAAPRKSKSPWRRRILICALLLSPVFLTLSGVIISRRSGDRELERAIAEADRLDPGWRLPDLEAKRLPVPDPAKNGIDQVARIRNASPPMGWPQWPFPQFDDDPSYLKLVRTALEESLEGDRMAATLLNSEQERVLRAELIRIGATIEMARRLPEFPYGRFPLKWTKDFVSTPFLHRMPARWVAGILTYDARLRAHDGDVAGALQDVRSILHASRAIGDEPTLQSQLIRIACDTLAVKALENSLACGRVSERQLAELQKELEIEAQTPFFLTGIRGERAGYDAVLEKIQQGEFSLSEYHRFMIRTGGILIPWGMVAELTPSYYLKFVTTYLDPQSERAEVLQLMNELVEIGKLPAPEMTTVMNAKEKVWVQDKPYRSNLVFQANRYVSADIRAKAILRTAYTALAVERFNLANGRWPDNLQETVPSYLQSVPIDPFDGAPLRMVQKGSAIVIYSLSQDRVDQGGSLLADPTSTGSDVGFVLHDPGQRRQLAQPFVFPPHPSPIQATGAKQ